MFEETMEVYWDLQMVILKDGMMAYYLVAMMEVNFVILMELKLEGMMACHLVIHWA